MKEEFISIDQLRGYSYAELIKVRNKLLEEILEFEAKEKKGIREGNEWSEHPGPRFCYQMNQEILMEIIGIMVDKYHEETIVVDETNADEQIEFIRNVIWTDGRSGDFEKSAKRMLDNLVKMGNADAINLKGAMYYEGRGVKKDQKKAVSLYEKAAEGGCSLAMSNLGYAYYYGNGREVDMQLAYKYFSMAMQRGEWDAINKLGDMYREGLYVPKDEKMAFYLYDQCYSTVPHDDGNDAYPACLVRIAECLYKGIGIDKNCDIAYELLQEAEEIYNIQIEKGNYYAKLCIDRVLRDLRELEELCSKNC